MTHHPEYKYASAYNPTSQNNDGNVESDLGVVPHQIRGSISNYQTNLLYGSSYNQCTCCSPIVLQNYAKDDFNFLERCFNDSKYLEELTGLKQLHEQTLKLLQDFDYSSEEEEDDENINEKSSTTKEEQASTITTITTTEKKEEALTEMSKEALIEKIKQLEKENQQLKKTQPPSKATATDEDDDLDGFEVL